MANLRNTANCFKIIKKMIPIQLAKLKTQR